MNAGRTPLFVLQQDCRTVTDRVIQEVASAGMQTICSFDLDAVRSANRGFCCPIHGASVCTCQLVILLILRKGQGSMTMILEGSDQQTSIFLDAGQGVAEEQVDPVLVTTLISAFFENPLHL